MLLDSVLFPQIATVTLIATAASAFLGMNKVAVYALALTLIVTVGASLTSVSGNVKANAQSIDEPVAAVNPAAN